MSSSTYRPDSSPPPPSPPQPARQEDLFFMFVSAALFLWFGFMRGLTGVSVSTGQSVPLFVFLLWTLRLTGIGFALAIVLRFTGVAASSLVYAAVGLVGAVALAAYGIWDLLDSTLMGALSPFLAFIFAAWNGFGSFRTLQQWWIERQHTSGHEYR